MMTEGCDQSLISPLHHALASECGRRRLVGAGACYMGLAFYVATELLQV